MSGVIKPMADIFLSYAKEDRDVARQIATLLGNAGWVVWWDRRIPAGRTWRSVLEEALQDMRCMVVLWSAHSIESDWVRDEADEARVRKKLVPVLIEAVNPPVGFRNIQAADLSEWDGSSNAPGVQQLLSDLESMIGKPTPKASEPIRKAHGPGESIGEGETGSSGATWINSLLQLGTKLKTSWKTMAAGGLGILLLAGVALLWPNHERSTSENVETGKANPTPQLVSLAVNGDRKEIKTNETLALTLRGEYSDGTQKEIKDGAEWVSSDSRVAIVDAQGQVKALEAGTAKIIARYGGIVTPEWTLAIGAPETATVAVPIKLVALRITGIRKELMAKEKISLQAKGSYSDGSEKTLSTGVVWESNNPAIAAVGFKGEIEGLRPGQVDVVVRSGGLASSPVRLVVKPAPRRVPLEAPAQKGAEASPVTLTPSTDQLKLKIAPYITRARDYRVQGNYAAALADLEKARRIDPSNAELAGEIDQTKRACNAERKLGRKDLDC
jgi:TIR domain/Bacterial Ig-like domain (group 2)